jgi:hypothetical protein
VLQSVGEDYRTRGWRRVADALFRVGPKGTDALRQQVKWALMTVFAGPTGACGGVAGGAARLPRLGLR